MPPSSDRLHVLLIEDSPGDARLISTLLEHASPLGLAVSLQHADSLSAGVERLRAGGVDLILLDLGLPESSGLETVQRLRTHAPHLPTLIVMSGLDDEEVAVQALQAGDAPIGHLLKQLFVQRESLPGSPEIEQALWRHVGTPDPLASRCYRVVTEPGPLMLIFETFRRGMVQA